MIDRILLAIVAGAIIYLLFYLVFNEFWSSVMGLVVALCVIFSGPDLL